MSFSAVRNQEVAVRLLRNIVRKGRVPGGLLLWGPSGVGKRRAALEMAKALNCEAGDAAGDACDRCRSCLKTDAGGHPDVKLVEPTGKTRIIKTRVVEDICDTTAYRPFEGRRRVYVIEEADRMNEAAQNKFLKTLEEPATSTTFILLTDVPRQLLPTVRSRCQGVRFGMLPRETVSALLREQRGLSAGEADTIAALSQGQMSRALDLCRSERRQAVLSVVRRLAEGDDPLTLAEEFDAYLEGVKKKIEEAAGRIPGDEEDAETEGEDATRQEKELVEAFVAGRFRLELYEHIRLFHGWYRDELVFAATGDAESVFNRDQLSRLQKVPGDPSVKIGAVDLAWRYLDRNIARKRVFRDLFFTLAG
ncbi:MAG TPA: DNA polymerase III subunit delta' [Candidatus Hydrogenedentes bacterium]|nr:DNA polymerase III subunit delta' [Candidatus Hydrogenedentota bacterium]HOH50104.1 DNA polymerase III subunit delta' [Candidatus Hydrogenedentota bacterium]HQL93397.1 DNA polymerase III subunit delta' [Candidatus Hydrogenedentota bacterium]HRZ81591.1 DNA polymerase III subunit delta' [Candidatus Hydrogenedentota bacterium]